VALTLQELLNWPPEIGDLAKASHDVATNHADSAAFLRAAMKASDWDGESGDTARQAVFSTASDHDKQAEQIKQAASSIDTAHQDADALANKVKDILNFAAEAPAVQVDPVTNAVTPPQSYDYMDAEAQTKVSEKIADVKARIADAVIEGNRIDDELAKAIAKASGLPEPAPAPMTTPDLGPLRPGESRDLGPVAGTGANPPIDGIGAADLGEVITLPDGSKVAILGDSYSGGKQGEGTHYPSVAVPVSFDSQGRAHFGTPLTGPDGSNVLFPLPDQAKAAGANNSLPAGSITIGKDTYMMVVGTNTTNGLAPIGGSWLVKVTNDPAAGWTPVKDSYRPWSSIPNPSTAPGHPPQISNPHAPPTQISGYQGSDGKVYIAADGFDRQQGVTMYRVDPSQVFDRSAWQPWDGHGFDSHGQPVRLSEANYGELSFREVDGRPVLSGFNGTTGNTELHVSNGLPASVLDYGTATTVVAAGGNWNQPVPGQYPQNYGGYILPGSTLDKMGLLVSQWNTTTGNPYVVEQFEVNANR
jgi:Domain of unknown function (DUF4185)